MTTKNPAPKGKPGDFKGTLGGFRPGSGRKPGTLNKKTIERQKKIAQEVEAVLATMPDEDIDAMDAVAVMRRAMIAFMKSGNLAAAVSVARDLAPYQSAKVATMAMEQVFPADLASDPPPAPDEPGPENPILG